MYNNSNSQFNMQLMIEQHDEVLPLETSNSAVSNTQFYDREEILMDEVSTTTNNNRKSPTIATISFAELKKSFEENNNFLKSVDLFSLQTNQLAISDEHNTNHNNFNNNNAKVLSRSDSLSSLYKSQNLSYHDKLLTNSNFNQSKLNF